jgi:hypothetical protein
MPVRFGVEIQHRPELLGPVAVRVEALGFDSVWVGDHLAFHNPTLDVLGALSYVAALTRRVRIGSCVYLLALRHPTIAAKQVASLDVLAGGRVVSAASSRRSSRRPASRTGSAARGWTPAAQIPDQLERFAAEIMPRVPEWSGSAAAGP